MLFLVLADGHMRRVIDQDVGGHQRGIGKQAQRRVFLIFAGLVLPLGHALHPAHARDTVENPRQLRVLGHLALVEQDRLFRIDTGGDKPCAQFTRGIGQFGRVLPDGDGMQIDHAENRGHATVVLHVDEPGHSAQIIAQSQVARGLDP